MLLGTLAPEARAGFVQFTIPANADVVAESAAAAPSGLDGGGRAFLTATQASARAPVGQVGNGLPDNGQFTVTGGTIQLLSYTGNNVFRLSGAAGGNFAVNVTPAKYQSLTLYATCGDGPGTVTVGLNYSDGTVSVTGVTVPDWFSDPPPAGDSYLIDGLDRTLTAGAGFEDATDPAIFAIPISPEPSRTLNSITITRTSTSDTMSFFAVAGNTAPLIVTKTADTDDGVCDADCSLREAIAAAAPGDTVTFAAPLFDTPQVIDINSQLLITKNLTITGKGANLLTIRHAPASSSPSRVFQITGAFTIELSGMTVTGGNTTGTGGGIFNPGTLTLRFVHVTGNTAGGFAGGISNTGTLNVISSTVSNNTANNSGGNTGGGIDSAGGTLTVINSTISGNRVPNGSNNGGGIWSNSATITSSTITDNEAAGAASAGGVRSAVNTVTVRNTIIAANRNNSTTPDVIGASGGTFTSNGYNIIGNAPAGIGFTNGANNDQVGK